MENDEEQMAFHPIRIVRVSIGGQLSRAPPPSHPTEPDEAIPEIK